MDPRRQILRAVLREQRAVTEDLRGREIAGLYLEAIVPVAAAKTFHEVSRDGEIARSPLADDMEIFVQHEWTVGKEFLAAAAKVDPVDARGGDGPPVETHVDAVLDDLDLPDGFAEQAFERQLDVLGGITPITDPHVTSLCKTNRRFVLT